MFFWFLLFNFIVFCVLYFKYKKEYKLLKDLSFNINNQKEKLENLEKMISIYKKRNYIDNPKKDEILASKNIYKAGKITDCYIEISKKDLEKLDLFLKLNSLPVNIIFHCENDEQHFIFTEVDYGKDYYDEEKNEIIHKDYLNFKEERK